MNAKNNDSVDCEYGVLVQKGHALFFSWLVLAAFFMVDVVSLGASAKDPLALPPETKRVCLSLRVLSQRVNEAIKNKTSIDDAARNLGGIGYLECFIVDETGEKDIILVGRQSKKRPSLHLDDLVVNMRNLAQNRVYPRCSLDPHSKNVAAMQTLFSSKQDMSSREAMADFFEQVKTCIGPQQVVVGGVPKNSRHAHVMIDADYHMKKVAQEHIQVPGVMSELERSLEESKQQILEGAGSVSTQQSMSRFWFHIGPNSPSFQETKGAIWLDKCPVVVLTERQSATASGDLYDVNEDDPLATAFAEEFSQAFSNLTQPVSVYADLENLFRLRALLLAMRHRESLSGIGWDDEMPFLKNYRYLKETPMPNSLPGLANRKEWSHSVTTGNTTYKYYLSPFICGGVSMEMEAKKERFDNRHNAWLFTFRMEALFARPSQDALTWEVPATEKMIKLWRTPLSDRIVATASRKLEADMLH
jgi:hypothetical protein